ncbi:uncharacterized protein GBIM_18540 [Gryllus bimaculatus]|nr:uncharacterized protein GBIM_18540 [Gryllus bimaculatus]
MDDAIDIPVSSISKLARWNVQCVGPWFIGHWEGQPVEKAEDICLQEDSDSEEELTTKFDKDDVQYLRGLDPKEWKDQDHYAVLGLSKMRHKATEEDIKKAYRMKVLRHHPDKRKALGEEIRPDDDYFTCITKAWEILGNPRSRRSFDSVDPEFDDGVPSNNENSKTNFFEIFAPVFELNARWSEKRPVPKLGDLDSSRDAVEEFYAFWYNFESWREYSYLDEEEKEKGQAKEERRWIEKQNKAARAKLKKEEMSRIRLLVDTAYALDPRIHKFKQDDKDRKLAAKQAKKDAARARIEEEERRAQAADEEARRIKAEQEAEEKAKQSALKAERDAQKKALKVLRTALRKLAKSKDYYAKDKEETVHHMASLEKICESFQAQELDNLISRLATEGRDAFVAAVNEVERRIEEERQALMDVSKRGSTSGPGRSKGGCAPWTPEELQLLIKAVNIFPAGTNQRWEVVANFINQHHSGGANARSAKEVLSKAKDLQSSDYTQNILKVTANKKAYNNFEKDKGNVDIGAAASERFDIAGLPSAELSSMALLMVSLFEAPAEQQGVSMAPWTATEQQLLEQALKTYPSTTPERWEKIAECIPTRSKKDCMRRYKELVEMVKAKKAAQAAAATVGQKEKKRSVFFRIVFEDIFQSAHCLMVGGEFGSPCSSRENAYSVDDKIQPRVSLRLHSRNVRNQMLSIVY